MISWENYTFVVDCGPDFRQQMLASKCDKVDGIIFTHEHSDHTAGIDDIRPFKFCTVFLMPYRVAENGPSAVRHVPPKET
jgi:phosphoribosyl 1,2-cyclic phosphodiesterase